MKTLEETTREQREKLEAKITEIEQQPQSAARDRVLEGLRRSLQFINRA
jgi:hypothetical protein